MQRFSPSRWGWAFFLLVTMTAAGLRLWGLGTIPPGLYRDEAYNGLDALNVLQGQHALYFAANNGREPIYIYLTALSVSLLGRTALAVRLGAAVISTLTTWLTYHLARAWFGRPVGLLAAWLWATTVWPLHLGRIGFRAALLPAALALTFWLATLAYRRRQNGLWLAAGGSYGLTFYTYLAARFTPVLLLALAVYWLVTDGRGKANGRPLRTGLLCFALGALLTLSPLAYLAWQQPDLILGRSGQVSIANPAINQGDLWGALGQSTTKALGLFFIQGDTIGRHNPPGRPLFDPLMALPFLVGLVWAGRHWRRPPAALLLLWVGVMLGPTILAEDSPHFLRAVGILPAAIFLPAIGLSKIWSWPKLAAPLNHLLLAGLLLGSLGLTIDDYFVEYGRQAETAYWFEAAARDLAAQVNAEAEDTAIFVDQRFWSGWPSLRFLVGPEQAVRLFEPPTSWGAPLTAPAALYVWPHAPHNFVAQAFRPPALVTATTGSLARGDLETAAYPLYIRYAAQAWSGGGSPLAFFGDPITLRDVDLTVVTSQVLQVDLSWEWSGDQRPARDLTAFVHVEDAAGRLVGQSDGQPAGGHWPTRWWRPGLVVLDTHKITLDEPFDPSRHRILVGLYDSATLERLPVTDAAGRSTGDTWLLR
ncbi:MAG: glycosyltransferase family 39 protein [Chloroflexota bacterium]